MDSKHKMICLIGCAGFAAAGVAAIYDSWASFVIVGITAFILFAIIEEKLL